MQDSYNKKVLNWSEEVILEDGSKCSISKILPASWCLLILFRHAECMECNFLIHNLNSIQNHFKNWDITLVGVTNGEVKTIQRLRKRLGIAKEIVLCAHPQRKLHKKLNLHSSFLGAFGLKAIWHILKGFYEGHLQSSITIPMKQQSGIVLLNDQKEICWIHRSKYLGDIPSYGEILEQVLIHRGGAS
jgi:peroxiredoxin